MTSVPVNLRFCWRYEGLPLPPRTPRTALASARVCACVCRVRHTPGADLGPGQVIETDVDLRSMSTACPSGAAADASVADWAVRGQALQPSVGQWQGRCQRQKARRTGGREAPLAGRCSGRWHRRAPERSGAGAGAPWQWACEISVGRYVTARAPGGRLLLERKGDHRGSPRAVVERSRGM